MVHSSSKLIGGENIAGDCEVASNYKDNDDNTVAMQGLDSSLEVVEVVDLKEGEELGSQSIWNQTKEIVMFSGPATGLWICGPLMSLISTAIIGQRSSTELAALGCFLAFMFSLFICHFLFFVYVFAAVLL